MSEFLMMGDKCLRVSDVSHIDIGSRESEIDGEKVLMMHAIAIKTNGSEVVLMRSERKVDVVNFIKTACEKLNQSYD